MVDLALFEICRSGSSSFETLGGPSGTTVRHESRAHPLLCLVGDLLKAPRRGLGSEVSQPIQQEAPHSTVSRQWGTSACPVAGPVLPIRAFCAELLSVVKRRAPSPCSSPCAPPPAGRASPQLVSLPGRALPVWHGRRRDTVSVRSRDAIDATWHRVDAVDASSSSEMVGNHTESAPVSECTRRAASRPAPLFLYRSGSTASYLSRPGTARCDTRVVNPFHV